MLETLGQTNIARLNLEEPKESGLTFDPRRDIGEDDWKRVFTYFGYLDDDEQQREIAWAFLDDAAFLKILSPERARHLDLLRPRENKIKADLMAIKNRLGRGFVDDIAIDRLKVTKILYPDLLSEVGFEKKDFKDCEDSVRWNIRVNPDNFFAFESIANLKILFPDKSYFRFDWDEAIDRYPSIRRGEFDFDTVFGFTDLLACLRITDEERFKKFKVTERMWIDLRKYLHQQTRADSYLQLATNLAIMAAEKVVITDDQFYLVIPNPDVSPDPIPGLPEVRKF
ncbi:MAG: hypothetical protein Q7R49_02255 [Candidatus Daviesbacteria bacterium]|nr:hypothetical protein [Candidatus Daviesbacteria bacterium]